MTITRYPTELGLEEAMHYSQLQDGKVTLSHEIDGFSAGNVIRDLEYAQTIMSTINDGKGLTLYINSPGGGIYDAISIYDYIKHARDRGLGIRGVVRGHAASAASMIVLQACYPRISSPNSRFLLHEPQRWSHGSDTGSSLMDDAEEFKILSNTIFGFLAENCTKTAEQIRDEIVRRETWFSAAEAYEWGLIDEIGGYYA